MGKCIVPGCPHNSTKKYANKIHYHNCQQNWAENIPKESTGEQKKLSIHSKICGVHFSEEDKYVDNNGTHRLKKTAVPTLFGDKCPKYEAIGSAKEKKTNESWKDRLTQHISFQSRAVTQPSTSKQTRVPTEQQRCSCFVKAETTQNEELTHNLTVDLPEKADSVIIYCKILDEPQVKSSGLNIPATLLDADSTDVTPYDYCHVIYVPGQLKEEQAVQQGEDGIPVMEEMSGEDITNQNSSTLVSMQDHDVTNDLVQTPNAKEQSHNEIDVANEDDEDNWQDALVLKLLSDPYKYRN